VSYVGDSAYYSLDLRGLGRLCGVSALFGVCFVGGHGGGFGCRAGLTGHACFLV